MLIVKGGYSELISLILSRTGEEIVHKQRGWEFRDGRQ